MRVFVVMISLLSGAISQKNLAQNGTASQSTNYYYKAKKTYLLADLAINGGATNIFGNSECSVTWWKPFQRFAWWMLTFPVDTVYITNVKIYYRSTTPQNLAGYSLYISNSSTLKTGFLCYHHTGPQPSSTEQNVNCNHLGKNIIFYNERMNNPLDKDNHAIVELCYIEVNGCYKGWWGSTCSNPCPATCVSGHCWPGNGNCVWGCNPDKCRNDTCDTVTGKCTQGCKIGRRGDYCEEPCAPETFGSQCSGNCHCVNQTCNPIIGTCPAGGCKRGYKGDSCSTECVSGRYGYNCNQSCDGCLSDSCDKEEGVCRDRAGCKPGWQYGQPWKCDQECVSETFGNGCSINCHCVNQPCNPVNGTCPAGGCKRGYEGNTCSTECGHGHYGFNCNKSCDGCLSDACDRQFGTCTNTSGCKPGRQSGQEKCDIECNLGNYGFNCIESCDGCLSDSCDKEDGVCRNTSGCKPGRQHGQPWKCDNVCVSGTFGNNCFGNCHCVNQPCDPEHGTCLAGGCQRGYKGSTCSTECSLGHYGYNCDKSCDGCLSDSCDKEIGICTNTTGCKLGRQPEHPKCDIACDDGTFGDRCPTKCYCESQVCNKITGKCPHERCQRGWMGETCSEECSRGFYGFNCANICNTCNITLCERYEGNCTHGCMEGYTGYQCLSSVKSQSDGQTTSDNTMTIVYTGVVAFIVATLMCVIIFLVILRYKLGITCGDTKKQNGQNTRGYLNDVFTNDYADIGTTESHYEETIPSSEENNYDKI